MLFQSGINWIFQRLLDLPMIQHPNSLDNSIQGTQAVKLIFTKQKTDKQTDRQADRRTNSWTSKQIDKQTD